MGNAMENAVEATQRILRTCRSSKDIYTEIQERLEYIREMALEIGDYSDALDATEGLAEFLRDLTVASAAA